MPNPLRADTTFHVQDTKAFKTYVDRAGGFNYLLTAHVMMNGRPTQKALSSIAASLTTQIETRQRFISGQAQLVAIKSQSDLEPVDFGCLGDGPVLGQGPTLVSTQAA